MNDVNSAVKLRDILFSQMDRLNDPKANLQQELQRATALAKVGTVIVNSAKQEIEMVKLANQQKTKNRSRQIEMKAVKAKPRKIGNG